MTASDDSIYYRDGLKLPFAQRVFAGARYRIYDLFRRECRLGEQTTIVDVGVSEEVVGPANIVEKLHPHRSRITCAGIGDRRAVLEAYPGVAFQAIEPGRPLPFADRQFDVAFSNAVLEHVGGAAERRRFIAEMMRIADLVFISVPNRWFPVEHHTGMPLLHYAPGMFRSALRGTRYAYWTDPANLDFLDRDLLRREWPDTANPPRILTTGIALGRFSSNLAAIWSREPPPPS